MALTRTTLTAPITASQLTFGVTSTANANFPAVGQAPLSYQPVIVDDEVMFLVSCPALNMVTVRMRGPDGTEAVAHDTGSSFTTSANPQDFPALQPGALTLRPVWAVDDVTYGQDGAIAVPIEPQSTIFLAKATAGAYTLGAPSLALNGILVTVTSQSAAAHVITTPGASASTGLFYTGGAGGPFTIATFPAQIGASFEMVAQNGAWNVINASISPVVFT